MKLHEREMNTIQAGNALREAIADVVKKFDLTEGEALRVVIDAAHSWISSVAKYAIREERHGDASKPGGRLVDEIPRRARGA